MSARIWPLRASPTRPWLLAMPDRRLRRSAVGMTAGMMSYVCIEFLCVLTVQRPQFTNPREVAATRKTERPRP